MRLMEITTLRGWRLAIRDERFELRAKHMMKMAQIAARAASDIRSRSMTISERKRITKVVAAAACATQKRGNEELKSRKRRTRDVVFCTSKGTCSPSLYERKAMKGNATAQKIATTLDSNAAPMIGPNKRPPALEAIAAVREGKFVDRDVLSIREKTDDFKLMEAKPTIPRARNVGRKLSETENVNADKNSSP